MRENRLDRDSDHARLTDGVLLHHLPLAVFDFDVAIEDLREAILLA